MTSKNKRKLLTEGMFLEAKERLAAGDTKRAVAKAIGIPESTLRRRLLKDCVATSLGRFQKTFTPQLEEALATHIRNLDQYYYGLTRHQVQALAYEFAVRNNIENRFNEDVKKAGKHWLTDFCKRHNLSSRVPEKCSAARASGFNRVQCEKFFKNLAECYEKYKFEAEDIFNMDESGISTVPNKLPKVISPKGKKTVSKIVTAERGQTITIVCCMSASGRFIPPGIIFPRLRMNLELFRGALPGTLKMVSELGYMNSELFVTWLKHFHKCVAKTKPVLLILDNHISHCSLDAIEFCRNNNIVLLSLPPHASHKLQPLDRVFFGALKCKFSEVVSNWVSSNPGEPLRVSFISSLFTTAYNKVANLEKGVEGFRCTGIKPYNPDIFSDVDFAPSEVTNQPSTEQIPISTTFVPTENLESIVGEYVVEDLYNDILVQPSTSKAQDLCEPIVGKDSSLEKDCENLVPIIVTPSKIISVPKAKPRERKRKGISSEVLTKSPYVEKKWEEKKNKLKEEQKKLLQKKKRETKSKKSLFGGQSYSSENNIAIQRDKDSNSEDVACIFCNDLFSRSKPKEKWIQCTECKLWAHTKCAAGISNKTKTYICEICT